ncbi:MAG: hypothetical protein ABH950_02615 [Candidatus Altiarchaeota archaeon]
MTDFDFRLRFHFLEGDSIECDAEELVLFEDSGGHRLTLKSGMKGVPIKNQSRVALIGGPYPTKNEALHAANIAKKALLIWAVTHKVGIDLGDGKIRSCFTEIGLELTAKKVGKTVRNDLHGIDVYEHQEDLMFALFNVKASIGKDKRAFINTISEQFRNPSPLAEKQLVSSELYTSSFFDVSFRSRIITLISSIEALLAPPDRSAEAVALVEELTDRVREADVDDGTKNSMIGGLQWLRQASIGQTGKTLSEKLLPDKRYLGKSPTNFFGFCYEIRSQIVHRGCPKESNLDLLEVANALQAFVGDLLLASFKQ